MEREAIVIGEKSESLVSVYFAKVYTWMSAALVMSALIAWWAAHSQAFIDNILTSNFLWLLIIAEFGLVIWISGWVQKMSMPMAAIAFFAYAALNGLTLSSIFLVYTTASIVKAFGVSAALFGAMSLYGYMTKRDLTSWGSFLIMALIGILIGSLVNLFFKSPAVEWVITYAGILIFIGLSAYDTQKLKHIGLSAHTTGKLGQLAILGALILYLDLINLFLFLLRAFGNRR